MIPDPSPTTRTRRRDLRLLALALALAAAPLAAQAPARQLSLREALDLARPASSTLGIAKALVLRARGEHARAKSEFFPQLSGSLSYSYLINSQYDALGGSSGGSASTGPTSCGQFVPDPTQPIGVRVDTLESTVACLSTLNPFSAFGNLPFGRKNTWNLGLQASQTLFTGGRISEQTRAAAASRRSAEIGVTAVEAQTVLDVTQAYYDAALSDQLVEIARTTLEQAESTLVQTRLAREVGRQPEFEVLRAQVTRDNAVPVLILRRTQRDVAYLRLKQLIGFSLDEPLTLTTSLDDSIPAGFEGIRIDTTATRDSLADGSRRAPVRQAVQATAAQEHLLKAAQAQRWPAIVASSSYGRVAYPSSGVPGWNSFVTNWSVGVGLQLPIFTGGRISGDVDVARANLSDARFRLKQTTELAQIDTRDALAQLSAAEAAWAASRSTIEQAGKAYDIADLRYREGISTQTELLSARLLLEEARANRAQASRDLQIARARVALLEDLPLVTTRENSLPTQSAPGGGVPSAARATTQTSGTTGTFAQ